MKKYFLLGIISAALLLSACDFDKSSIGIIGGVDGPTGIIVSEDGDIYKKSEISAVKTVKTGGVLYYENDADTEFFTKGIDGSFTKGCDIFEIPQNDNESNFKDGHFKFTEEEGYIGVYDGDDLEIFKMIDNSSVDVSKYKYILKVEAERKGTDIDTEFIVLSNDKQITANEIYASAETPNENIYILSEKND